MQDTKVTIASARVRDKRIRSRGHWTGLWAGIRRVWRGCDLRERSRWPLGKPITKRGRMHPIRDGVRDGVGDRWSRNSQTVFLRS